MMENRLYALEKFAEEDRTLTSIAEVLPTKRRAIDLYRKKEKMKQARETYVELEKLRDNLLNTVRDLSLLFCECDMPEGAAYAARLYNAVSKFNLMTESYDKFLSAIGKLQTEIPKSEKVDNTLIGRLMNNVKMGYFPTELHHVKLIKQGLQFPDCRMNLLDSCCGCGLALETLARGENAATYGIEIDEARGREAEGRLDRVGFGSFFHSSISHDVFHVLFLNPPYLNVIGEGGKARSEKRFLVESLYHLMQGGILVYIIPYYRLTYDVCRVLCDNFRDISVYRFLDSEFAKFKQIAVFGVKKPKDDGSEQAERLAQAVMQSERIPYLDTLPAQRYILPDVPKPVQLFKGAVFNLGELQRQLADSKSIDMLFEKSRIDAMEKRPLLPLNIGQIGLIGGSGFINGYVDCEYPHVIKGRVIKEVKRREDEAAGTLTETRVNRMLFNVLTPEGLKKLA